MGEHELTGHLDGQLVARLAYTTYPLQGPMISGPHEEPFYCETQTFEIGPGAGALGASVPPLCVVPTREDRFAVNAEGGYFASVEQSVVSVETGVINRAVYQIARPDNWNGKLIYKFGGGCRAGWYRQGDVTGGVLDHYMLERGYAVASATLNVFGVNCNDLLAAETMMMVKERFIEQYGVPRFTIGYGCSGGSYQAHQIADNYPRLLDGILVGCSFPEVGHAGVSVLADARLLKRYFDWANAHTEVTWTPEAMLAVSGFANLGVLEVTAKGASRIVSVPVEGWTAAEFADVIPAEARFDPVSRPTGARPTVFDHTVNVYGRDEATGYARWPFDNRGIQYGLAAFKAGKISARQFVHLNASIGGYNRNGEFVAERTAHDTVATKAAYESGRILDGGQGLRHTPIIDYRVWADARKRGDTHLEYHTYSTRERLRRANGHIENHVILMEDGLCDSCSLFSLKSLVLQEALAQMDRWLTRIKDDTAPGSLADKISRNRPADLVDACWIDGNKMVEPQSQKGGRCNEVFPTYSFPREVAGAPVTNNIVACHRRGLVESDYAKLAGTELEVYRETFMGGVCDWTQPGEGQVGALSTWWRVP
jgi:hypothetical protein